MARSSPLALADHASTTRSAALLLVRLGVWALVLFHVLLLARRIGDASLSDPVVALRWLGALLLLASGILHRRSGGSLVAGRGALAFWVAVFLLHAFALAPGGAPVAASPTPAWTLGLLVAVALLLGGAVVTRIVPADTRFESASLDSGLDRLARCWGRPPPISLSA